MWNIELCPAVSDFPARTSAVAGGVDVVRAKLSMKIIDRTYRIASGVYASVVLSLGPPVILGGLPRVHVRTNTPGTIWFP